MTTRLRPARPAEAAELRALAHRAKAHWPYSPEFLASVRPLLHLEPADIRRDRVTVLEEDGRLIGWHRLRLTPTHAELEDLWVEPGWIGRGHGRVLFEDAVAMARGAASSRLEWDAEPYAAGFYAAMGGEVIGQVPSAVQEGRLLPRMRLELALDPGPQPSRRRTSPIRPYGGRGSA